MNNDHLTKPPKHHVVDRKVAAEARDKNKKLKIKMIQEYRDNTQIKILIKNKN